MTTYNTGNPIGSTDARDLYDNAQVFDNFANGGASSYADRLGVTRRSLAGIDAAADNVLNSIGYAVPVAYASGISLTMTSQTVDYNGVIYAPKSSALPFTTSSWGVDSAKFRAVQVTDADLITYTPAGTGAVATTVQTKLRDSVSVKDFGAVGNGTTDDTAAVHAAITYAKGRRGSVFFPSGTYRVTSGYTQSVTYADVHLFGEGSTREGAGGSHIKLDSTDAAGFFYRSTANHNLQVNDLVFSCAQFVQDRAFFKLGANTSQFFNRVNFESVERPIVYSAGGYFQSAAYRDVQFRNSGTFHSESSALLGTLLVLDNVNHEGSVPANTEKIVCNLKGIRDICGTNFLLEGALPASGWTILNFDLGVTVPGLGTEYAGRFDNYHSEWSGGNQPTIDVNVNGMSLTFSRPAFGLGKICVNNSAFVVIDGWVRVSDYTAVSSNFTFVDTYSRVVIEDSILRSAAVSHDLASQLIIRDSSRVASGAANDAAVAYPVSVHHSEKLWEWNGGLVRATSRIDPKGDNSFWGLRSIETHSTYGRIQRVNRNGQNYPLPAWRVFVTPEMVGKPLSLSMLANFPAINGGTYLIMYASWDGGAWGGSAGLSGITTGSFLSHQFTVTVPTGATYVEFNVGTNSGVVASDLLIAAVRITCGIDTTPYPLPAYPAQVVSFATAAPTTGTWAVGDRVVNSAPAAGQPKGWACTVAGTPGTWVSEGNL